MSVLPSVRAVLKGLDPNLPLGDVRSFDDVVTRFVSSQRMNTIVLATFSGFGLLLATLGIYGVLSYSVSRRIPEIGLRMALGASEWGILKIIARQGLLPALLGITIGGRTFLLAVALYQVASFRCSTDRPAHIRRGCRIAISDCCRRLFRPRPSRHEN
jgi:putative ABC transport system permease protein